jgi:hypothetical protein
VKMDMSDRWRTEYLEMKGSELSDYQRKLLQDGPHSLAQAWALQAMKREYTLKSRT